MKNKAISKVHHEVKIYEAYYKPSINPLRVMKSILGVLLLGKGTVLPSYAALKKRSHR
jgi:hypothetical protein